MSINTTVDGTTYAVPETGERGWGAEVTNLLVALGDNSLLIKGGNIPLTSDADFGANFGLVSIYYKSRSADIAGSGVLRLSNTDAVAWRNGANSADLSLSLSSDRLRFNSINIVTESSIDTLTNKTLTSAVLNNQVTGTAIETDLSVSASATKIATADAIKSYVDTQIGDNDDASEITYTPTTPGDWVDPDPTNVQEALDDIAAAGFVTATRLATDAVETAKILNSNVTGAKIEDNVTLPGSGSVTIPTGNTASRVATAEGSLRRNSETSKWEGYNGTSWEDLLTAGAIPASDITYDNSTSGLTATDAQAALDEIDGDLDTHVAATSAHGATGNLFGLGDNPQFTSTGSVKVPTGTTAQRPGSPVAGQFRFNSDDGTFEGYDGTEWGAVGGGGLEPIAIDHTNLPLTAEAGFYYLVDMSSATADETLTLPDIDSQKESVGVQIVSASTDYNLIVAADASDDIEGAEQFTLATERDWRIAHAQSSTSWSLQRPSSGNGTIVTGWSDSEAVAMKGDASDPTTGTIANSTIRWRRVGDSAEFAFTYRQTTAGVNGSGDYYLQLPSNFPGTIDSSKMVAGNDNSSNNVGQWFWFDSVNGANDGGAMFVRQSNSTIRFKVERRTSENFVWNSGSVPTFQAPRLEFSGRFTIPVAEWQNSGTSVTLQDLTAKTKWITDNSVLGFSIISGSATISETECQFFRDSLGNYSAFIRVWLTSISSAPSFRSSNFELQDRQGLSATTAPNQGAASDGGSPSTIAYTGTSGDVAIQGVVRLVGKPSFFDEYAENSQTIDAQVQAPKVSYEVGSTYTYSSLIAIDFDTEKSDFTKVGNWSNTNGVVTVPESGYYDISACVQRSTNFPAGVELYLYKNGTLSRQLGLVEGTNANKLWGSTHIEAAKDDTIELRLNNTGHSLANSPSYGTWWNIVKVL